MKAKDYLGQFRIEKAKDKSENTVAAYMSDLAQFLDYLHKEYAGNKEIEDIRTEDIKQFRDYLLETKIKPKTVNRKLVSIRRFIDFLNNNTEIKVLAEIKLLKIQKQDYLDEVLTKSEFDRLVKAAEQNKDKRAIAVFFGLYLTGARVSEFLQITVGDIKSGQFNTEGKGSKYRELLFTEDMRSYLSDYIGQREAYDSDPVFVNVRNNKPMDRQGIHKLIKKYAGIAKLKLSKCHAHAFRHLCAFRLLELGFTLDEVADILGHKDINTTRIYTRRTKQELLKAMNRLH